MKKALLSKSILALILMCACITNAGGYNYSSLRMKTYDEMQSEVKRRVQAAEKLPEDEADEAKGRLKDALRLILSRPNNDNMVSQLVPIVRLPLKNLDHYELTLSEIATESISSARDKKNSAAAQATALILLDNMMSELKPDINNNKEFKKIFEQIRDAKISISNKAKSELRLNAMITSFVSPSETAKKILASPLKKKSSE